MMLLFLGSSYCDQSWAIGGDEIRAFNPPFDALSNLINPVALKYLLPSALISPRSPGLDILTMTVLIDLAMMGNSTLAFSPGNAGVRVVLQHEHHRPSISRCDYGRGWEAV
jgi:hypothetical protein